MLLMFLFRDVCEIIIADWREKANVRIEDFVSFSESISVLISTLLT